MKVKSRQSCVHLLRYLAKVSLQHCAVKSELESHSSALALAEQSFKACVEALKLSYELCSSQVKEAIKEKESGRGSEKPSEMPISVSVSQFE
jgi:hypothetical protein